jgi:hypothetical protein
MDSSSGIIKQQSKHGFMAMAEQEVAQDHHHDSSSSSSDQLATTGPLSDLSSLLQQLPIK